MKRILCLVKRAVMKNKKDQNKIVDDVTKAISGLNVKAKAQTKATQNWNLLRQMTLKKTVGCTINGMYK
ncbi:uncharacterized protein PHALS_12834 [Plasmopara halstedii]|uniref:Uncharacterized protein n=1 Tax=Plasmopara halstedii TaxID=4781 RepID=A0A0P1AMI0_PLAHL|nr:uncharacterized protein PHALS_12834 [Plasmopara halstedii]CEG42572.1 hypothetical protein PHALS_12834 [Plasmopara halstedii]|eukprot:XP_024578941.1 hypothetical protein PHALS_12834 [Plasmopara halstedii]